MTRVVLQLLAAALVLAQPVSTAQTGTASGVPVPELVEVPAGRFVMGTGDDTDAEAFENERWSNASGQGTVDLPTFYIARTETTVAQFAAFLAAANRPADRRALDRPDDHPVAFVSWPDALAYCRWLERVLKEAPGVPTTVAERLRAGWRILLPNEAQWEKAARGTDGRRFPWGAAPRRDRATYESTAPAPAGRFPCPECPYGLQDLSGNVWEWTSSPYQPYPYDERDDRSNLASDALWTIRGGHFADPSRMIRTTARTGAEPGARRAFIGFRIALVPPR